MREKYNNERKEMVRPWQQKQYSATSKFHQR